MLQIYITFSQIIKLFLEFARDMYRRIAYASLYLLCLYKKDIVSILIIEVRTVYAHDLTKRCTRIASTASITICVTFDATNRVGIN